MWAVRRTQDRKPGPVTIKALIAKEHAVFARNALHYRTAFQKNQTDTKWGTFCLLSRWCRFAKNIRLGYDIWRLIYPMILLRLILTYSTIICWYNISFGHSSIPLSIYREHLSGIYQKTPFDCFSTNKKYLLSLIVYWEC